MTPEALAVHASSLISGPKSQRVEFEYAVRQLQSAYRHDRSLYVRHYAAFMAGDKPFERAVRPLFR